MVRSATEAVKAAKATTRNTPGMCQKQTRTWLGAESPGDVDRDGDVDAVDGWKSEPASARHTDISKAPAGAPVAWSGGSGGFGHRAISVGGGFIRSTDAGGRGVVATRRWDWFEKNWGLRPLGWSETISGHPIPGLKVPTKPRPKPAGKPVPKPKTRGTKVDAGVRSLQQAKAKKGSVRDTQLKKTLAEAYKIPYI